MRSIDVAPPITSQSDFDRVFKFLNHDILNLAELSSSGAQIKPTKAKFAEIGVCNSLIISTKSRFEFTPTQSTLILNMLNQANLGYRFSVNDSNFE